jgi:antitoxin (DNA-binding transcriptional repressor) of toxin-antitoxin stability system
MSVEVSVEAAKKNLEDILMRLSPGETATLTGPEGRPLAVLVPLKSSLEAHAEKEDPTLWDAEWEDLARKIEKAWKSKKSALEILSEMRR